MARGPRPDTEPAAKRALRVAFLTDSHLPVSPGENSRMSRMLDRVLGQPDKPELVVFGGDNVMAVDEDEKPITVASAQAQFDNWAARVMDRLNCPSLSVIGNHDIFWKEKDSSPAGDPKRRAMKTYRMPDRYYSRQVGGWKFLLLDTFHADGCKIDDPQFRWLERAARGNRSDRPGLARPHPERHRLPRIQGLFPGQVRHTGRLGHRRRRQAQGPFPPPSARQARSAATCIRSIGSTITA